MALSESVDLSEPHQQNQKGPTQPDPHGLWAGASPELTSGEPRVTAVPGPAGLGVVAGRTGPPRVLWLLGQHREAVGHGG